MTQSVPIPLSTVAGAIRVPVRVLPRSSRTHVGGTRDGRLLVRVTAPPVDHAANAAAIAALADALGVPVRSVVIASGASARNKTVEVRGLTLEMLVARIQQLSERPSVI